jgi:heme/copper-type cytochrome/quinol oxidase subunit 2
MSMSYFKIVEYPSRVYAKPQGAVSLSIRVGNYGEEAGVFHVNVVDYNNNIVYTSENITLYSAETTYVTLYFTAPQQEGTYTYKLQAFNEDNNKVDNEVTFTLVVQQAYPSFKIVEYTDRIATAPLQQYNIIVKVQNTGDAVGRVVVKLMTANKSQTIQSAEYELEANAIITHTFTLTAPYTGGSLLYAVVLYNETNDTIDDEKYVFVYVIANRPIFRIKELYVSTVPPSPYAYRVVAYPKQPISYTPVLTNIGDKDGRALVIVKDQSGAVLDSIGVDIAKHGEGGKPVGFKAPAEPGTYTYTIEIYNVDVGAVDDARRVNVKVLRFNTSIELLMPDRLKPNATAWVYGRLTASDGLKTIGLEGINVKIVVNNAEYIVKTKIGGYFRLEITTPSSGVLDITASYDGVWYGIEVLYPVQVSKTITIDPNAPDQSKPSVIPEDVKGDHELSSGFVGWRWMYNASSLFIVAGFTDERGVYIDTPLPVKIYRNGQYYKDADHYLAMVWDSCPLDRLLTMVSLVYEGSSAFSSNNFGVLVINYMPEDLPPEPEQPETPPPPQQTKSLKIVSVNYPSTVRPNTEFNVGVSIQNLTSNVVNAVVSISEPVTYTSKSVELTLNANELKTVTFTLISGSREQSYTYTVAVTNKSMGLTEDAYVFTVIVTEEMQQPPAPAPTPTPTGYDAMVLVMSVMAFAVVAVVLGMLIGALYKEKPEKKPKEKPEEKRGVKA